MRAVAFAFLLAATAAAGAGEGFKARGFILPDGAVKIDEDRYRLPQPWDEAVKFYRRAYPPGHIENPERGEWEGVNLYEAGRGEVRVYILAAATPPPPPPPSKSKSP